MSEHNLKKQKPVNKTLLFYLLKYICCHVHFDVVHAAMLIKLDHVSSVAFDIGQYYVSLPNVEGDIHNYLQIQLNSISIFAFTLGLTLRCNTFS